MIDDPKILHVGTRVLVFSNGSQITPQDMMMADVAIAIQDDYFLIVKDRFKQLSNEKFNLNLLSGTLEYYYEQIIFRLHDQNL